MDLNSLEAKLNKIQNNLKNDSTIQTITEKIKDNPNLDEDDKHTAREEYYLTLSESEKIYQKNNDEYKDLISQFSKAYLELTDFYVGPELPREHYLQSKKDVIELYKIFAFFALWEPYINAFHEKLN